ncbi:MAG: tripartite tricarboxylate transporter TctB family protein [Deltaproteobacteria bacterium]|nr:tripartite tricarboxylate transporter TctB family protein [Deltaproteobacteria bacterium]
MSWPQLRSVAEGGVIALLGLGILLLIPTQVEKPIALENQIPPSFLPKVIAISLMLTGGGMLVHALLRFSTDIPARMLKDEWTKIFLATLLLFSYAYLFPRLGFMVSSALIMGLFIYLFGGRSWVKILLNMALVSLGVWFFFEVLFAIPLPRGILF